MDIRLNYLAAGTGKPLILLHGNGEDLGYFSHQIAYFRRFFRVLAIDTRGHGRSPRGGAPFTIAQFAQDLYDWMGEQGIDRASILGFSDGANIALAFALRHPEMVERLILNGGNLDPRGVKRRWQIPIEIGYAVASRFAKTSGKARRRAELLGLMVNEPQVSPVQLRTLQVPTLVIAGTRDMILERHTRQIAQSLPNARLVLLEGGHAVAAQHPSAFNRAVAEFLCVPALGSAERKPLSGIEM